MQTWVAFLRGMNVGGHRITNAELVGLFEGMGFARVSCYRASGNVLFGAAPSSEPAALVERGLREALGYEVPTFVRSRDELREVVEHRPFTPAQLAGRGKLQITFLPAVPSAADAGRALAHASDEDLLALRGRELYWLPKGNMSDSVLDHRSLARLLGHGTTRTGGTVQNILAKLG